MMNASAFGGKIQEQVTPEGLLLDAVQRVGRIREGRMSMHLHLSRLLPQNREDGKLRIAFRIFESMVDMFRGQLFHLANGDMILICKDARLADLDSIVYKLRALFAKDPLTYAEENGVDRFVTFYDLETEYDEFNAVCNRLQEDARKRASDARNATQIMPLDSINLGQVLERIGVTDIAGVVRRQPCFRFTDKYSAHVEFQEFFMSIADLQKALAPDVNILANRWLFQHLSQVLDLRVLSVLQDAGFRHTPVAFSVNLNMATVSTPVFQQFEAAIRGRAELVVEFQLLDIFNNLDGFFRVRDQLRAAGHKSVLDGMSPITLQFMDAELYDTDYIKLAWAADMADDVITGDVQDALGPVGFDKVILSRCDTESSVAWGLTQGIRLFQGRFLDGLEAAITMSQCPKAAACTAAQCTQRHAVISGRVRAECGDNDMLDLHPPLQLSR